MKLTTPEFELYTDASNAKAKDLLELFEAAETAALRPAEGHGKADKPLRIIAFANSEEYAPFRLKSAALGHYLHAGNADYIVLADAEPEHYGAAVHEYTHYAVNRAGYHLPLWLNEGIADLYSTTTSKTGTPLVGGPLSGRLSTLAANRLLQVRDLFAAERASWLYNDGEKTPLFYAESWALTRLLALDDRYAAQFPRLLAEVSAGHSSEDALWDIYRRTPEQFEAELAASIRQVQDGRPVPEAPKTKRFSQPGQVSISDYERRIICAELLAAHPSTAAKAKEQLLELEKRFPEQPQTEELLGHIAWATKHPEEARNHWGKQLRPGRVTSKPSTVLPCCFTQTGLPLPR